MNTERPRMVNMNKLKKNIMQQAMYLPCSCNSGKKYKFCCFGKKKEAV